MTRLRVGDVVSVPWGLRRDLPARIIEVWGDPPQHIRVELILDDEPAEHDPFVLLLAPSMVRSA